MEEVLSAVNSEFADQLDGEIEYVNLPWDNFYQVHLTAVNSGTPLIFSPLVTAPLKPLPAWEKFYYMDNLDVDEEFALNSARLFGNPEGMKASWFSCLTWWASICCTTVPTCLPRLAAPSLPKPGMNLWTP